MARKKEEKTIVEKIFDYSLEEIMGTGFGRYAKEIIQERALPDVRDGLKPVQRRILYGMYASHFTYDKPYRKSARAVGDIMGKYHPHGDSSIYDALIRMSQPWKMREVFIDIHGNNGSIDGDGPAAMRYTESRLSKFAEVMLTSINKNTVEMTYNFDDTELEPTVLPAGFPNLLVNGSTGISAGYATNIPPHNLGEVIDATVKRIESPNCKLETIMEVLKGPDYPTYGVLEGKMGLIDAYRTGKGKVVLKAKTEVVKSGNHEQIIVSSIPYEVVKEQLIKKINEIRIDKKVEGINEVIDESDHENLARIVIDLKNGANSELVLNYLLKNTDLQINYNFNMVAIVNRRPKLVGVLDILDAFITHQREVVRRRTQFDLDHAKVRYHILEGLVKAISILDEVIRVIRASKNKSDAIDNLVKEFEFSFDQAKAIVELQLYRLTNTDIVEIEEEMKKLEKNIYLWTQILNNEEALKHVMKTELKVIKREYGNPRRTEIRDEVTEIKLDMKSMIPKENVMVVVTNEGYVKRVSLKSYASSNGEETTLKPGDYVTGLYQTTTIDSLMLFTNLGNYLFIPIHKIPEVKWKELGKHINHVVMLQTDEKVVASCLYDSKKKLVTVTKNGMMKRTLMSEYEVTRTSKAMLAMKLKDEDEVVTVFEEQRQLFLVSKLGYYVSFAPSEVPLVGVRGSGVKGINLKDDVVACAFGLSDEDYLDVITNQKTAKRVKLDEFVLTGRAKRGNSLMKKVKSVPYEILTVIPMNSRDILMIKSDSELREIKNSEIAIMDLASTGSNISKYPIDAAFKKVEVLENNSKDEEKAVSSMKEITMEDFLDDFKL
ncbi:MAG: DNA topoisomerase IV subunit A [Bacilli bacterium]|nr:DNA topoisomerase IV subunit A [Bacilli bacterium]